MPSLTSNDFDFIRQHAPLVSIDLIIYNQAGQVLLGRRINQPAQGKWFVPGGRVRKDETLTAAFHRIASAELGPTKPPTLALDNAQLLGVFEHHYPAGPDPTSFSVHYVVLGYKLTIPDLDISQLPTSQHAEWKWFSPEIALQHDDVHLYTKRYLKSSHSEQSSMIHHDQYYTVASRRAAHDTLLWQTPILSLTAQAFLFTIAFNDNAAPSTRFPASALIVIVAIASIQLMMRHRTYELDSSQLLCNFESNPQNGFRPVHRSLGGTSSYRVWLFTLSAFLLAGLWAAGVCTWEFGRRYERTDMMHHTCSTHTASTPPVATIPCLAACQSEPKEATEPSQPSNLAKPALESETPCLKSCPIQNDKSQISDLIPHHEHSCTQ